MTVSSMRSQVEGSTSESSEDLVARRANNAYRISLITAIVMAVLTIVAVVVAEADYYEAIETAFVTVIALISAWLSRRKRQNLGVMMLIVSLFITEFAFTLVTQNQAIPVALLLGLIAWYLAYSALPPKWVRWIVLSSVLVGLLAILLDLFGPNRPTGMPGVAIPLSLGAIIIYSFLIIRQFRSYSLRTKLILGFLVVALIPLALLAVINIVNQRNRELTSVNQTLYQVASETALLFDEFIDNELNDIRVSGLTPDFINYLELSADQRTGSIEAANARLALISLSKRNTGFISSYALLDKFGLDVMDSYTGDIGHNYIDQDYFDEPMRTGLPFVSPVRISPTTNIPSLYFSAPVRDALGNILGVIRVRYDASVLQKKISTAISGSSQMYAVVVDSRYYIRLAHSKDPTYILTTYDSLDPVIVGVLQNDGRLLNGPPEKFTTNQLDVVDGLKNVEVTPFFTASDQVSGQEMAVSAVVGMTTTPWLVIARQNQASILAPIQAQTRNTMLLALVVAMTVAGVGVGFSQLLAAPIRHLTGVAERVSTGDLTARAVVETSDEIGTLASTFNDMTIELQDTLAGLERRVADRTRAVELSAEVSRRLSTILDPRELVTSVVEQVQAAFHYYHAHIYLYDEAHQYLVMMGGTGEAGKIMLERGHKIPADKGLVGRAATTGMNVLVSDTTKDPSWLPNPLLPDTRSEVAVPIIIGDQIFGVLDVQQNVIGGLGQEDVDILSAISNQVAVALRNARQYVEAQRQAEHASLINTIVHQIQGTQTVENALQVAIRELGRALKTPQTRARLNIGENSDGQK